MSPLLRVRLAWALAANLVGTGHWKYKSIPWMSAWGDGAVLITSVVALALFDVGMDCHWALTSRGRLRPLTRAPRKWLSNEVCQTEGRSVRLGTCLSRRIIVSKFK